MKHYTAEVERSGGWWAISVLGLRGVHTQARRLGQVEPMVREAIALSQDVPEDSFTIDVVRRLPASVQAAIDRAATARAAAEDADRLAAEAWRLLAQALLDEGLTVRDAGDVMGISHQRVAQLATAAKDELDVKRRRKPSRVTEVAKRHVTAKQARRPAARKAPARSK